MKQAIFRHSSALLAALLLVATGASAERTFKWVDAQGNTHYGDRVPLQAATQQRQEINEQGRTLKEYPEKTAEEIAEEHRLAGMAQEKQQQSEQQAQQDSELLSRYATENDLLEARDSELDDVNELIRMTNIRIDSLQKRLAELTEDASGYEQRGKPVPEFVQHQASQIREQIVQNQGIISTKQAELETIKQRYAADMTRYQELHNHKLSAR